jgi:hypothetical protein
MPPSDDLIGLEPLQPIEPSGATEADDSSEPTEPKPRSPSRNGKSRSKRSTKSLPSLFLPLLTCVAIAGLAFGGYKLFETARAHVGEQDRFRVAARDIEVTPLPVWIRTDLLAEVQRLGDLSDTLDTLDQQLAENLRDAFALHPWVREVIEVRVIHPATIRVKLDYREPVAVVRATRSLEAVDRDGVLLPAAELPDPQIYLTVTGVRSTPTGPAGTQWDDAALLSAVATADALSPHHRTLGLSTIDVSGFRGGSANQGTIYLLTEQGTRVKWGRPPNVDYPGEVPVQDKIDRLLKYVTENESLDKPSGPYEIDVTHWQEVSIRPRSQSPIRTR